MRDLLLPRTDVGVVVQLVLVLVVAGVAGWRWRHRRDLLVLVLGVTLVVLGGMAVRALH